MAKSFWIPVIQKVKKGRGRRPKYWKIDIDSSLSWSEEKCQAKCDKLALEFPNTNFKPMEFAPMTLEEEDSLE